MDLQCTEQHALPYGLLHGCSLRGPTCASAFTSYHHRLFSPSEEAAIHVGCRSLGLLILRCHLHLLPPSIWVYLWCNAHVGALVSRHRLQPLQSTCCLRDMHLLLWHTRSKATLRNRRLNFDHIFTQKKAKLPGHAG